jgi:hypothetical protein
MMFLIDAPRFQQTLREGLMAEAKTKPNAESVADFLGKVADEKRRKDKIGR